MHMLRVESRSIDGTAEAVDLDQTPADIVALSFTDTDLSVLARRLDSPPSVWRALERANREALDEERRDREARAKFHEDQDR